MRKTRLMIGGAYVWSVLIAYLFSIPILGTICIVIFVAVVADWVVRKLYWGEL